jgi:hypothetical protein
MQHHIISSCYGADLEEVSAAGLEELGRLLAVLRAALRLAQVVQLVHRPAGKRRTTRKSSTSGALGGVLYLR